MPEVKETEAKLAAALTLPEVLQIIENEKIISVVRTSIFENVEAISNAVIAGGIRAVAISVSVPQRFKFIESLAAHHPHVIVGACHVENGEQAQKAIEVGARFVSSAFTSSDVISVCRNSGTLAMQGAQTATEIMEASRLGVDLIQIFPAGLLGGPAFIRTVRDPLPPVKLIAGGGVTLENVVDFFKAGVTAVMVDEAISDRGLIRDNKWNEISERAKLFYDKIASLKTSK